MKFLGVFVFFIFSLNAVAGTPATLSFEDAEKMKVSVSKWYGIPKKERTPHKEYLSCTPFEILVPLVDQKHRDFTKLIFSFELIKNGKVFLNGNLSTSPFKTEPTGVGTGCLPLDSEYQINVTFSYNPESGLTMCPPAYTINNFVAFVKSAYNKPIKRD